MDKSYQELPNIINEKLIYSFYEKNYQNIATEWFELLNHWLNESYKKFKDQDKYLILVYLVQKSFDIHTSNFATLNMNQFYNLEGIEIQKFNIIEITRNLNISKETARRKIGELENNKSIEKKKKKLLIKNNGFVFQQPQKSISRIVLFLNKVSQFCAKDKIIDKEITKDEIEKTVYNKFSYAWKLWYEMLIPTLVQFKSFFHDLETFHIFGAIVSNENFEINKYLKKNQINIINRFEYIQSIKNLEEKNGINAMTISTLTGIPRATVIRKLEILLKKKFLFIDKNKLYKLHKDSFLPLTDQNTQTVERLSKFTSKIFNLIKFN